MGIYNEVREQSVDGAGYLLVNWSDNGLDITPLKDTAQLEEYMKEYYFQDDAPDYPILWETVLPQVSEGQLGRPTSHKRGQLLWVLKVQNANPKPVEVVKEYKFNV